MKSLSFASSELRLGYSAIPRLDSEPFAELKPALQGPTESVRDIQPAEVPVPQARPLPPVGAQQSSVFPQEEPSVTEEEVPSLSDQTAALPVYDESKDPYVTSVLRPVMTNAEVEQIYRRRPGGKVTLPPMEKLPVIETESVRTALASASE